MVERLHKDLERIDSDFKGMNFSVVEKIKNVFGRNSLDEEIKNYAVENRNEGDVIVNYSKEGQKFVLVVDLYDKKLIFITDNLPHHINIKRKYVSDCFCLGGGRIMIDDKNKVISLYGRSRVYGGIYGEVKEAMVNLLGKNYPGYEILFDK